MTALCDIVDSIAKDCASETDRGAVAAYIPELACVDPSRFGLVALAPDGEECATGDADERFSIQSVSKVFSLTLVLEQTGRALWDRVGREPSGDPFNSIVQLEHEMGVPRNPLINAGAIVVIDHLLEGCDPDAAVGQVLGFIRRLSGDDTIDSDPVVAASERAHGARNRALANFMKAYGNLHNEVDDVLDVYFRVCAIAMSCRQLARAGRFLAWDGRIGPDGEVVTRTENARRINALMLTCGHYDGSGEFAYRVGFPGKSGVGGGILAVVPGQASIGCWSPGLNEAGNSKIGTSALERLAGATGWSVFSGKT